MYRTASNNRLLRNVGWRPKDSAIRPTVLATEISRAIVSRKTIMRFFAEYRLMKCFAKATLRNQHSNAYSQIDSIVSEPLA